MNRTRIHVMARYRPRPTAVWEEKQQIWNSKRRPIKSTAEL